MGADNWARCPKCEKKRERKIELAEQKLLDSYGVVPLDKYKELEWQLDQLKAEIASTDCKLNSLREDYEVGIYGESFEVTYSGFCNKCDFKYSYKFEQDVLKK